MHGGVAGTDGDEVAVPVEEGVVGGGLGGDVDGGVVRADGKPGVGGGAKGGSGRQRRPLHGRALAIAAFLLGPAGDADGVADVFLAGGGVGGHADLGAVVGESGGAGGVEDGGDEAGDERVVRTAVAEAVPTAGVVVVVEDEQGLVGVQFGLRGRGCVA